MIKSKNIKSHIAWQYMLPYNYECLICTIKIKYEIWINKKKKEKKPNASLKNKGIKIFSSYRIIKLNIQRVTMRFTVPAYNFLVYTFAIKILFAISNSYLESCYYCSFRKFVNSWNLIRGSSISPKSVDLLAILYTLA